MRGDYHGIKKRGANLGADLVTRSTIRDAALRNTIAITTLRASAHLVHVSHVLQGDAIFLSNRRKPFDSIRCSLDRILLQWKLVLRSCQTVLQVRSPIVTTRVCDV